MANVIRYKTSQPDKRGLRKGNTVIGIGDENYGPTSTTGYVNGITPPDGGYVVYILSSNNDPAIYVAETEEDLVSIANTIGGSVSTVANAKTYLAGRANTWVVDSIPNNIITDGLVLHINASNLSSYPEGGVILKDLSGNDHNATLNNGPSFNSNGYISFDGVNDFAPFTSEYSFTTGTNDYTFEIWFKMRTLPTAEYGANGHIWGGENGNDVVMYLNLASNGISRGIMIHDDSRYNTGHMTNGGFEANTWAQWVAVGNSTNNTITHYINGKIDRINGPMVASQENRTWGGTRFAFDARWGTHSTLDLAVARQYNRQLTAEEVAQNFYGGEIVTDGLIRALDFSNIISYESGNSGKDLTENDTFTLINTPTKINDYGGGLQCSTNEFIVLDDKTATNYVTVEVLYRRDGNEGGEDIVFNKESTWELRDDNGNVQIALMASNQSWFWYDTGIDVAVGEIAHITMTYNGDDIKTYKNGILEHTYDYPNGGVLANQTTAYPKFNSRNATKTSVQNPGNRTCFIWRIYDRALTADEVLQNFNAQKARFF